MINNLTLTKPSGDEAAWTALPMNTRDEVRRWIWAFEQVPMVTPVGKSIDRIARILHVSPVTVRRKYDAIRNGADWTVFIDRRGIPKDTVVCRTKNKRFRNYLLELAESYQRASAPAIKELKRRWSTRTPIPGYEDFPNHPAMPHGWSKRNLQLIISQEADKRQLTAIRRGTTAHHTSDLAQVFSTRVGLYPAAVYQFDDMWHDNFVRIGAMKGSTRVIELACQDLFTGAMVHWGFKPRIKQANGSFENLRGPDMRFFIAALLHTVGYSPRGTRFCAELGTAVITDDLARIITQATNGLVTVIDAPIDGKQQALTGFYPGTTGGNFRFKAMKESSGNLIHNDLSHLAAQTGKDRDHRPDITNRLLSYQEKILRDVAKHAPERIQQLILPTIDFHSQFAPLVNDYYRLGFNARTEHQLEGWRALGFHTIEYTTAPGSGHWLTEKQFLALPEPSRLAIGHAAQDNPDMWLRRRNLSPAEVWEPAKADLLRIPPHSVCDILSGDLARDEKVKGSYFRFRDIEISPEELLYESRVRTLDGHYKELKSGESYKVFVNPFAPDTLFVCDSKLRYLGTADCVRRVVHGDDASLLAAQKQKAVRNADILEPLRIRHLATTDQHKRDQDHNTRVITGAPITDEEKSQSRKDSLRRTRLSKPALHSFSGEGPSTEINPEETFATLSQRDERDTWDDDEPETPSLADL